MKRLLIVSNRLPVTAALDGDTISFRESAGGLVTGLGTYLDSLGPTQREWLWVGWPGADIPVAREESVRERLLREHHAVPVFVDGDTMSDFYEGFCNNTLWPLFHYFQAYAVFEDRYWANYRKVNHAFCRAVLRVARPGDVIWVQDYHLMLLPHLLRERLPDVSIGFFLHVPFPSYEVFRILPARWRGQLLDGVLGADLVGFHTNEYAQHFLRCVLRLLGHEHTLGRIHVRDRVIEVDAFPMGIDYDRFHRAARAPETVERRDALRASVGGRKIIVSVDRLDYTKGILNRLEGYEHFLASCPWWHKKVVLALVVVPSREGVERYQRMKRRIDEAIGKINGRYGSLDWVPVSYQFTSLSFPELVAFYAAGDVALVTPLRDGMNLVAKEYVASRVDDRGVLILSELAGASRELGEAVTISPTTREEVAQALETALEMPVDEQAMRIRVMQERLRKFDVRRWADDFLDRIAGVREEQRRYSSGIMSGESRTALIEHYRTARKRLLLLDYDGTLVPFAPSPEAAQPSPGVIGTLSRISRRGRADLVLVSGRPRDVLDRWFAIPEINLVAEHGAWLKRSDAQDWRMMRPVRGEWKQSILPVMRAAADRLPGAFVEEKEYSLVWHYRRCDPEPGSMRAKELADGLVQLTANMDLVVVPGHRIVEVREAGISKAHAALEFLNADDYDFVFAVGDDATDEDMFRVMPEAAYSVRVGIAGTHARFNVAGYEDVLALLDRMAELDREERSVESEGRGWAPPT